MDRCRLHQAKLPPFHAALMTPQYRYNAGGEWSDAILELFWLLRLQTERGSRPIGHELVTHNDLGVCSIPGCFVWWGVRSPGLRKQNDSYRSSRSRMDVIGLFRHRRNEFCAVYCVPHQLWCSWPMWLARNRLSLLHNDIFPFPRFVEYESFFVVIKNSGMGTKVKGRLKLGWKVRCRKRFDGQVWPLIMH